MKPTLGASILGAVGLVLICLSIWCLAVAAALYLGLSLEPSERPADVWFWVIGFSVLALGAYFVGRAPISSLMWISLIHATVVGVVVTLGLVAGIASGKITIHWGGPRTPEFIAFFATVFVFWFLSPMCLAYSMAHEKALPKGKFGRAAMISNVLMITVSTIFVCKLLQRTTIGP